MGVLLAAPALPAAADVTTGLVAYYPLNGNALDVSGNGRHGTIIGASATSDRYGNPNAAMGFDGNDYIVASAAGLPTVERTVSLWFRLNTIGSSRPFPVLFAYGGCGCPTTWFEYVIPGTVGVFPHCNGGMFCNYAVSTGVWYHLVFTASSPGGTAMYVNGQFVCSSPVVLNTCTNAGTQLAIGVCVNAWAGQAPFTNVDVDYTNGAIDEVRIYDRALSATEVQALYNNKGPSITIISGPAEGQHLTASSVAFSWSATDAYTPPESLLFAYRMDSGQFTGWSHGTTASFSGIAEGLHAFEVKGKNLAGDLGVAIRNFGVDGTPPTTVQVAGPSNGGWINSQTVTFQWRGTDNLSPVDSIKFQYLLDESAWSNFGLTKSVTYSNLTDTIHTFSVRGKDRAGNIETVPLTISFGLDFESPNTWITSGQNWGQILDTFTVRLAWMGSDNKTSEEELTYSYKLDINNFTAFSSDTFHTFANLSDGSHLFIIKAKDRAGNEDPSPDSLQVVIDGRAPVLSITAGPLENQHLSSPDVTFNWMASDIISPAESLLFSYRLDSEDYSNWEKNDTSRTYNDRAEGLHIFEVKAKDERGHIARLIRNFGIDLTSPNTTIASGPGEGGCHPTSSVTFGWSATDNLSKSGEFQFAYKLDEEPYSQWLSATAQTFSGVSQGSHSFSVKARDKAGNEDQTPATVSFSVGWNDLEPIALVGPDSAFCNRQIAVTWSVRNNGSCSIGQSWYDLVYLSADSLVGSDVLIGSFQRSAPLGGGESYPSSSNILLPDNIQGKYWLILIADGSNNITEEGYENNNAIISHSLVVSIPPHPDFRVMNVTMPNQGMSGQGIYVEWTIRNAGNAAAPGAWKEYVYLSADSIVGSDQLISTFNYTGGLAAAASYTHSHPTILPTDISGPFWIVVCADGANNVNEYESEGNNCRISAMPITVNLTPFPDLQVTAAAVPPSADAGSTIDIEWTVTNAGSAPTSAPTWYDAVYLSSDPIRGNDTQLGSFQNLSYLNPGQSYPKTAEVTLPYDIAGTYYLFVQTDINNHVDEHHSEGNNVGASNPISIQFVHRPSPFIQASFIPPFPPTTAWTGQPMTVHWEATNAGDAPTTMTFDDILVLSQDEVFDGNDIRVGHHIFHNVLLDPGESDTLSYSFAVPGGISGPWRLILVPDTHLRAGGGQHVMSNSINIRTAPTPDLEIIAFTADSDSAVAGTSLSLEWTVSNPGPGPSGATSWRDAAYLSEDDSLDPNVDILLGHSYHSGYLDVDSAYTVNYVVQAPNKLLGPYTLFLSIDSNNEVSENNENNNRDSVILYVMPPPPADLRAGNVAIVGNPWSGASLGVSWTVSNQSLNPTIANSWVDNAYLSPDSILDRGVDPMLLSLTRAGILSAGQSYCATGSIGLPNGIEGLYYIIVCADADSQVYEPGLKENNVGRAPITVQLTPSPDLRVTELLPASVLLSGGSNAVQWTVSNVGAGGTIAQLWVDKFYLSADSILTQETDNLLASFTHSGVLQQGLFYQENRDISIPSGYAGSYYLIAHVDANNQVYEHNGESNNTKWAAVTVSAPQPSLPDLKITSLEFIDGQRDTLAYSVKNDSPFSVPVSQRHWTDRLYLSVDSLLNMNSDALVASFSRVGDLAPGSSYSARNAIHLPNGTDGDFYLFGFVDAAANVTEEHEDNNVMSGPISVNLTSPDLQVTNVDGPDTLLMGQPGRVVWTVSNLGNGLCDPDNWYDGVYLSRDKILDETDTDIGAKIHTAGLPVGSSYLDSMEVTIPPGLSGKYYFFVKTDKSNGIYEHAVENNNVAYVLGGVEIIIPPPPDLLVTNVSVDSAGAPGEEVRVSWSVINAGYNPAVGQWTDAVYVSADSVWNLGDPLVGTLRYQGELPPGGGYVKSLVMATEELQKMLEANLPGVMPGEYWIIAIADVRNNISESNERNNEALSSEPIAAYVQEIGIGNSTPFTVHSGDNKYFRIHTTGGIDLRIAMDTETPDAVSTFFVRRNQVPDMIHFDFKSEEMSGAHQELTVPRTPPGDYYVFEHIENAPIEGSVFQITVDSVSFGIDRIAPDIGGNIGEVTIRVSGGRLVESVSCELISPTTDTLVASDVTVDSSSSVLFATFDLSGRSTGRYDVCVHGSEGTISCKEDAFEILDGRGERVVASIASDPPVARPGNRLFLQVAWENVGDINARPPLLFVSESGGAGIWLESGVGPFSRVALFGVGSDGPMVTMRPGQSGRVTIYSTAINGFSEYQLEDIVDFEQVVNWDSVAMVMGEDWPAPGLSTLFWNEMHELGGSTWGEFYEALRSRAEWWADQGFKIRYLDQLYAEVILEALDAALVRAENGVEITGGRSSKMVTDWKPRFWDVVNEWLKAAPGFVPGATGTIYSFVMTLPDGGKAVAVVHLRSIQAGLDIVNDPTGENIMKLEALNELIQRIGEGESASLPWPESKRRIVGKSRSQGVTGCDPNEKTGPTVPGEQVFVAMNQVLSYRIYFENMADAIAPAQRVVVTDQLDPSFDLRRFRLSEIAFGDTAIMVPDNRSYFNTTMILKSGNTLELDAGIDITTGEAHWFFNTLDPSTGLPPIDPYAGFLAPNDSTGRGEGHVTFTIKPKAGLPPGTEIRNKATIVFDVNDPIETNEVVNVIYEAKADLQIASAGIKAKGSSIELGDTISVDIEVANKGSADCEASIVRVMMGSSPTWNLVKDLEVPSILAGQTYQGSFLWIPEQTLEDGLLAFAADYNDTVPELDETNNSRSLAISVNSGYVSVEDMGPKPFSLGQNYPNPFNPYTKIEYTLAKACNVRLAIYNVLGQSVRVLVNGRQEPGRKVVVWDGKDARGNKVASGVYFYQVRAGDFVKARKMVLIR